MGGGWVHEGRGESLGEGLKAARRVRDARGGVRGWGAAHAEIRVSGQGGECDDRLLNEWASCAGCEPTAGSGSAGGS